MIFESLWPLAFVLAVPIIIVLYLLVPKGKEYKISSNLLWKKLYQNQQSKTFLEKFIHNLLMYLQIVIILLLVLALMSPYIRKGGTGSGNVVYVLDTSGSMQHENADGETRLAQAVAEIKSDIASSDNGKFSIITNDGTGSNLLAVASSDKKSLYRLLDRTKATDTAGDLKDAVSAVQTLVTDAEGKKKNDVIVMTDGVGAADTKELTSLFSAQIRVMGEVTSNVSNDFLSYAKSEKGYDIAAGFTNYSDSKATLEVSLYEKKNVISVRQISIDAGESYTCLFEDVDWNGKPLHTEAANIAFEGSNAKDSLKADNECYAIAESANAVSAVLVGKGNTYIEKAYQAVTSQTLPKSEKESDLDVKKDTVCIYDADTSAKQHPAVNRLVFADGQATGTKKKVSLTVSDTELTYGISEFAIGVNETYTYDVPSWGTGFLWAGDACAGYYGQKDGVRVVVVGFNIRESDFALAAEFPVFMSNTLSYLSDSSLLAQSQYEAGEKVQFHPQADFDVSTLATDTTYAGLYTVKADKKEESYVVHFATDTQSDGRITAEDAGVKSASQKIIVKKQLRNVILVLIIILLVLEWIVYVRQMRYRGKFYLIVRIMTALFVVLALFGFSVNKRNAENTTIFMVDLSKSNAQNAEAMDADLKKMIAKMPKDNQYGIVAFGKNSLVEQFVSEEKNFSGMMSAVDETATNLEDAVSRGLSMVPENAAGRLVILTDGKETKGNIESTASALVSKKVELLSILYDVSVGKDTYIENVQMPGYLYAGDSYSMTVNVQSNYDIDARLQVLRGSMMESETKVHLNKGANSFVLKQKVSGESAESFTVRVVAKGDTCKENNDYYAYAAIHSVPKILVVSGMDEDSSNYEKLLRAAGCNFQTVSAINAPESLNDMLAYKSIVLDNVFRTDLPQKFLDNLDTYVKDYGCGLICCGGEESFALGGYRDTELETLLPVDMEPRGTNESPSMAMVMVIDHSGSMSEIVDDGETNLDLAVAAAENAVTELRNKDYVGVVAFDDTYSWVVPITKAEDKDGIKEKIETIPEGGGTTIKPAVKAAVEAVKDCDAEIKHVVLLTDGQGETTNFMDVMGPCKQSGITLSTVAVGADSDTSLLEKLAEGCGGRYYYSDISTDIPKIFAREVFLSGETYLQNGTFTLSVNSSNAVTRGLFADGWPQISGYVSATPKSNANVLLASDKDDPVLSVMQYGLGHTVAWNTDVTNKWTKAYAGAEDYVQLWKRIVDYSVGNTSEGDTIDVSTANGTTTVTYHASEYNEKTKVEAVYTDPDGKTQTAKLQGSAPGVYEAKIDTDMTGIYNLSVRRMNKDTVENALTAAAVVQYSDEYKFALTNEKFKAFVKKYGKTITANDSLWKKLKASAKAKYDLTRWLLILAILWFVLDVAFRRFSFVPTDTKLYAFIKKHWTQKKNRAILSTKTKDVPKTEQPSEEEIPQQKKEKPKKAPKEKKKKPKEQQLDTSALLKKKEQRHQ